jgi:malic enzyme
MTVGELAVLRSLKDPLDRYVFLRDLRDVDEPGFYRLLVAYTEELLPIVYTPTVRGARRVLPALC